LLRAQDIPGREEALESSDVIVVRIFLTNGGRRWSCKIERYQNERPPSGEIMRRRLVLIVTQAKDKKMDQAGSSGLGRNSIKGKPGVRIQLIESGSDEETQRSSWVVATDVDRAGGEEWW
jgi:hypothetical protein